MDLDTLRTFIAVAQHGGVLAASRALRVPKQTVSRRLAQLEDDLGVALFEHDRRPLTLTDAGRLFAERCLSVVTSADAAVAEIQQRSAVVTGLLRVASPALFARLFLAPALGMLAQRHPLVRVELLATDALDPSTPWEFDVVIWVGALPDVRWRASPLGRAANVLCASPAFVASLGGIEPAELEHARSVHYTRELQAPTWHLARGAETIEVRINPWLRTNDAEAALAAVLAGQGVASLPQILVAPYLHTGRLQRVLPGWRVEVGAISALHRPASRSSTAVQALLEEVRRAVGEATPNEPAEEMDE
jgi:DNA-binding transcriptional LysR family regulator